MTNACWELSIPIVEHVKMTVLNKDIGELRYLFTVGHSAAYTPPKDLEKSNREAEATLDNFEQKLDILSKESAKSVPTEQ